MPRAKGSNTRKRHKKVLKESRGYRGARHKSYRRAKESILHAGQYAYMGRKLRKRDMRRLWIQRINAALTKFDIKYSQFINLLKKSDLDINRKILAQLAVEEPEVFKRIVEKVKK